HRYVTVGVHYLVRQCHEVARARAGVAWDEQSTRRLKNRDAHHVTDAKRDPPWRWSPDTRCVGPASSFWRGLIPDAPLVHKTRLSRRGEGEDSSDSTGDGRDESSCPDRASPRLPPPCNVATSNLRAPGGHALSLRRREPSVPEPRWRLATAPKSRLVPMRAVTAVSQCKWRKPLLAPAASRRAPRDRRRAPA